MNLTLTALKSLNARTGEIRLTVHFLTQRTYESYDMPVTAELLKVWREHLFAEFEEEGYTDAAELQLLKEDDALFARVYVGGQMGNGAVLPVNSERGSKQVAMLNLTMVIAFTITEMPKRVNN